jgi:hypothetical protein
MVPNVQSSTNCGLGCFKNKTKKFLCTNSHFLSGLTTAQAVDPLPLHRDFPDTEDLFCDVTLDTLLDINFSVKACYRRAQTFKTSNML